MKTKINFQKTLLSIAFYLALALGANAQTTNVTDAYITTDSVGAGQISCIYNIVLTDTNNVNEIELILGTKEGENNIVSYTCTYDITSGLPSGWSYTRQKSKISLNTGNYSQQGAYYGQVRVKTNGSWQDAYSFIAN
jgi:hypothetical protein